MEHGHSTSLFAGASRAKTVAGYAGMTAVAAAAFFWIRSFGEQLVAPAAPDVIRPASGAVSQGHVLAEVLLALAVISVMARLVGNAVERFLKQPPVMGEILAGIILGPSVLGAISAGAYAFLMPQEAAPHLGIVAKIGVVLFMFLVGMHLDSRPLRANSHSTLAISHASILAPFVLGAGVAFLLYPRYSSAATTFTVFSLFLGVSMSVTAFPVLARILTDRRIHGTPLGVTALACAAVDDATAWCLLAFVSGVATAQIGGAAQTVAFVGLYVAVMFVVVRPVVRWIAAREEVRADPVSLTRLAIVIGMMLVSAVVTERIGIHALFGAFLFGAFIPHDGRLARQIRARVEDIVVVLLLPIFFAFTGMRTEIGLLSTWADWMFCGLIILVATAGKFGGSFVAARLSGLGWRESSAIGVLMNTRGLMELIVLNVGLDMGILSPTLFAMLVIMALATTFSTTPVLHLIMRHRGPVDAPAGVISASGPARRAAAFDTTPSPRR
jgi:Kef-type K+ transport system membrane component KefB